MSLLARLRGTIEERGPDWLLLEVAGIGFRVQVPTSTLVALGPVGSQATVFTHLHLREDGPVLYGFATRDDLALFQMLISVSGVGPKGALALLSAFEPEALAHAIARGDVERLTRVPGIGRRTAERLALELRGKLREYALPGPAAPGDEEVLAALLSLGYSRAEAERAVATLPADEAQPLEERLRLALRQLAR
ncbi:MAG TPA: Holliday junction branch migration protein RuvA [Dehalococcoidia bacterium]|nr:Holliday junction branch migration protein RuvA [Dehalococcoidia bacterium]